MGLFNRKPARAETGSADDSTTAEQKKEKGGWKRPASASPSPLHAAERRG
jgi:hypothetical protein